MEIKLNAGDKITIPAGCKATIEDNLIIIEEQKEEQEEFKEGDILHSRNHDRIVIFSRYSPNDKGLFDCYFSSTEDYTEGWFTDCFRPATEEEKQKFFDDLKAKGLRWNAETKEMERIRERVNEYENYLFIDGTCTVLSVWDCHDSVNNKRWEVGNYYLPHEIEQAVEDAKAVKAIFEKRLKAQQ